MGTERKNLPRREPCRFTLAVDRYEKSGITGTLSDLREKRNSSFACLGEVLYQIEEALHRGKYPMATMRMRSLADEAGTAGGAAFSQEPPDEESDFLPAKGNRATLQIWIVCCGGTTWQGEIFWEEQNETHSFESALELLYAVDCMLSDQDEPGEQREKLEYVRLQWLLELIWRNCSRTVEQQQLLPNVLSLKRCLPHGKKNTFLIRLLYRRQHTLQGVLLWKEQEKQVSFRSFLELVSLIQKTELGI